MKRHSSNSLDQGKNDAKRLSTDQNSSLGNESSSNDSDGAPEEQNSSDPITSENQSVPSTSVLLTSENQSVQSFPAYAYANASQIMMQNQMMMYNTMRSFPWPDRRMYPMSMINNMSMSSVNLSFGKNTGSNCYTNSNCYGSQLQIQTECNCAEIDQPLSPSLVMPYSEAEAASVMEKLRNRDTFRVALHTLTTWLMRSEFSKSNISCLYSLIQCAHNNIWRLMNSKASFKDDFDEHRLEINRNCNEILSQFQEIFKVFEVAKLQKVWDQFTKAQRKQISTWIEETKRIMSSLEKQISTGNIDPGEDSSEKSNSDSESDTVKEEYYNAREKLDSLRNQIRASQDNNATLRNEAAMEEQAFEDAMRKLDEEFESVINEVKSLKSFLHTAESSNSVDQNKSACTPAAVNERQFGFNSAASGRSLRMLGNVDMENQSKEDVRLLAIIAAFLHVHPFGASVEYICSYLKNVNFNVDSRYVGNLMNQFPQLFKEETKGIGASLTKEWMFIGLKQK